jgi:xylulose-5-phosphate/fructose-6-phosphate phosphoketolase
MTAATSASAKQDVLEPQELSQLDAYWRAANYLAVGQIYLLDNPLLQEPLRPEHIKPRLLGHWGTTPGLNFIYCHLNRVIKARDLNMIFVCGPGHGGPAVVANTYLEGTYSEIYPSVGQDVDGMRRLFRQFSFPGGIPSHAAPETPGSIHEGGELGYSLAHACGAAFDNPELIVACVIGDGESETGPLAASWHGNAFLNPTGDGAVLPILHLNGYKIANPTILGRMSDEQVAALFRAYGYDPVIVAGAEPAAMHERMAATLDKVIDDILSIQQQARKSGLAADKAQVARWPLIILRTPKGWTGPRRWTASGSKGFGARTRFLSPRCARTPHICGSSKNGCEAMARRSCSEIAGASLQRSPTSLRAGRDEWGRTRMRMGGCSNASSTCQISAPTPWMSKARAARRPKQRG